MNRKNNFLGIGAFVLLFILLSACNQADEETEENGEGGESSQVTYESHVEEIIEESCISCHGTDSPPLAEFKEDPEKYIALSQGPRLDNYDDLVILVNGDDAGALMRRLDDGSNTEDGEPGNMYTNLGSTEEERQENLAAIKEWVGSWSLKRSEELTDEERAEITAVRE